MSAVVRIAHGIHRLTARHPEWHPPGFAEVAGYAVEDELGTILIDPLLDPAGEVLPLLDDLVRGLARIAITIPYHVRSAEQLAHRYDATIYGHAACSRRLWNTARFQAAGPGDELPGGARFHAIGRPRRFEQPIELPSIAALAFGDAVIEVGGRLRVWESEPVVEVVHYNDPTWTYVVTVDKRLYPVPASAPTPDVLITAGIPGLSVSGSTVSWVPTAPTPPGNHLSFVVAVRDPITGALDFQQIILRYVPNGAPN